MYEISYRKNNLGGYMELSYKRLFKKLIDLDMQHNELMEKANVSRSRF